MLFDKAGNAVFGIGAAHIAGSVLYFQPAVCHGYAVGCVGKHAQIVQAVAEDQRALRLQADQLRQAAKGIAL